MFWKWVMRFGTVSALVTAWWGTVAGMTSALIGQLTGMPVWGWIVSGVACFCAVFFLATYPRWWWKNRRDRHKLATTYQETSGQAEPDYLPYLQSWEDNPAFTLQQAAYLSLGFEPDHPTPIKSVAYAPMQGLINASKSGALDTTEGGSGEDWERIASREALITYYNDSGRSLPNFLAPKFESEPEREADSQLALLSLEQKRIVRELLLRGSMLTSRMGNFATEQGFSFDDEMLNDIRRKTDFLEGSYTGHFTINPELKEILRIKLRDL